MRTFDDYLAERDRAHRDKLARACKRAFHLLSRLPVEGNTVVYTSKVLRDIRQTRCALDRAMRDGE